MSEALAIRLKSTQATTPVEWLTVDSSGIRQGNVQTGTLNEAAAAAGSRKVMVFIPGTDVHLAEPVLPLKSGAKLLQVVPFALEEQIATDVEEVHFAVGRREDRPGTPVAAVSHELMQSWQTLLRAAGIHAEAIYAETSALPVAPNGVALLIDATRVYVRRENSPGAVLDVEPLIEALQLALAAGENEREHVTIYLTEDAYERERDLFEGLREFTASLQLKLLPDGLLPILASTALVTAPVNLLQGRYATKTRLRMSFQPWRYAAMLAGAFLVLQAGLNIFEYYDLKRTEARLDTEIAQVFQQAMPGAPVPSPTQARKQVEMRFNALRGSGTVGGMMSTLSALSEALAQAPGTNIEALSYREDATDLRVLAPSVDSLDKIQQAASEKGLTAQIESTNPRNSKVEGRLKLRPSGA